MSRYLLDTRPEWQKWLAPIVVNAIGVAAYIATGHLLMILLVFAASLVGHVEGYTAALGARVRTRGTRKVTS